MERPCHDGPFGATAEREAKQVRNEADDSQVRTRVLLVEDDDDIRRLLETALGERFEVASVAGGREAAGAMVSRRPDIMLADLDLPGMCGEALALRARALHEPPDVFLMSGDHERLRAARRLARRTIAKPFSLFDVVAILSSSSASAVA